MDFEQIVIIFGNVANASQEWLTKLFTASGATPFFIACLSVYLAVRFLIKPIMGGGMGSDKSKKKKGGEE